MNTDRHGFKGLKDTNFTNFSVGDKALKDPYSLVGLAPQRDQLLYPCESVFIGGSFPPCPIRGHAKASPPPD
jgi:hypothetical protein